MLGRQTNRQGTEDIRVSGCPRVAFCPMALRPGLVTKRPVCKVRGGDLPLAPFIWSVFFGLSHKLQKIGWVYYHVPTDFGTAVSRVLIRKCHCRRKGFHTMRPHTWLEIAICGLFISLGGGRGTIRGCAEWVCPVERLPDKEARPYHVVDIDSLSADQPGETDVGVLFITTGPLTRACTVMPHICVPVHVTMQ